MRCEASTKGFRVAGSRRSSTSPSGGHIEAALRSPTRSQSITYKDIAMLAHHFGVSYQAALYRPKSLRHSPAESRELLEQERFGREYLMP